MHLQKDVHKLKSISKNLIGKTKPHFPSTYILQYKKDSIQEYLVGKIKIVGSPIRVKVKYHKFSDHYSRENNPIKKKCQEKNKINLLIYLNVFLYGII